MKNSHTLTDPGFESSNIENITWEQREENFRNILRKAVADGTAKVLTVDKVTELKGKYIATIYFGYHHQDGVDDFIVGEVKDEYPCHSGLGMVKGLFTQDGRATFIRLHPFNAGTFTCSDSDRDVYFIEL